MTTYLSFQHWMDISSPASAVLLRRFVFTELKIILAPLTLREQLLSKLTNPNLAILLITLGGLLIYLEFNLPGTIVPGTLGAFFVLLGGFGLDLLPLHHTALLLILAALVMIGLEVSFYSHGILAAFRRYYLPCPWFGHVSRWPYS